MASSLIQPPVGSLSGQWAVTDKLSSNIIHFSTESVESANGYKLNILSNWHHDVLPRLPAAWQSASDSIALLDNAGLTVLFFSREGNNILAKSELTREGIQEKQKITSPHSAVTN